MYYRIYFNIYGRGHDRTVPYFYEADDRASAFKRALAGTKKKNPVYNIDNWNAFYIVPCDKDGHIKNWDKSKMHGWDLGGKISYPQKT